MESITVGGRDFWVHPKPKGDDNFSLAQAFGGSANGSDTIRAELTRYDHPELDKFPEYRYKPLPQGQKMIRLMRLYAGEAVGTRIYCELINVSYDKQFHIPTKCPAEPQKHPNKKNGSSSMARQAGDDDGDKGYRSDQRQRWQPKTPETVEEERARVRRQGKRHLAKIVRELKRLPEEAEDNEKRRLKELLEAWEEVKKNEVQYEALSWTWGKADEKYAILINVKSPTGHTTTYKKRVRKELALALKYLRQPGQERILWIDAICIDQTNLGERNHQVQMMSRIYTRASQVCVWLGEADRDSEIAINFIKEEIRELKNFDTISSNTQYSRQWRALMSLMQREWFFRRWVVQEIALAGAATVYCGPHSVPWKAFAVAVELFVEVETATHRLSEVMGRDEKFRHVPGWFEYVSELGASLLVQATGKVFRTRRTPMQQDPDSSDEEIGDGPDSEHRHSLLETERVRKKKEEDERIRIRLRETQTIDPLERRSLLSLEYLVTTMFIFKASEPRDVVYSLLAIARDASPFAPTQFGQDDRKLFLVMSLLDRFLAEKPFVVDYNRPYSDVSRDFVLFSIQQAYKTDPTQALDILCRPWALEAPRGRSARLGAMKGSAKDTSREKRLLRPKREEFWKRAPPRKIEENRDGFWTDETSGRRFRYRYRIVEDDNPEYVKDTQSNEAYKKMITECSIWSQRCDLQDCSHSDNLACEKIEWKPSPGWDKIRDRYFPDDRDPTKDIELPTWVARASKAPFMLDNAPGMEMRKTSRANADPLVGPPQDGHRNYNAAGPEKLDLQNLRFQKRPVLGHYSLYLRGFKLDEVKLVADSSQLGSIPMSWLHLAEWTNLSRDPPDEFWRTIVADRGRDNRNPPYYYARACKESVHKGGHRGGSVNTAALIHDEQNSIVAEFCRRVHAVIWNRSLFKTKAGRLGLASNVKEGDKVCILYGCTVPVILREHKKQTATKDNPVSDENQEEEEDRVELLKAVISRALANRERKGRYRARKIDTQDPLWLKDTTQEMEDARQDCLKERLVDRESARKEAGAKEEARSDAAKKREAEKRLAHRVIDAEKAKNTAQQKLEAAKKMKRTAEEALNNATRAQAQVRTASSSGGEVMGQELPVSGLTDEIAAANDVIAAVSTEITDANNAIATAEKKAEDAAENAAFPPQTTSSAAAPSSSESGPDSNNSTSSSSTPPPSSSTSSTADDMPVYWYEFIAECYVHGMMDGEAMREKFYDDAKQDQDFELR